ncbi:hypothetical protein BC938DRAFT_484031 [Jimgerdemannia flammicorona]|uniref:Uncharacterized protein n=1 Tax=Jimgerdemannia flammicorona TaxID=994334 RepID=A0A433QAM6_9FUNG|nr:hypothetical protein BC938DRAFT_484031 [Jimgerdemannia flammicorona]
MSTSSSSGHFLMSFRIVFRFIICRDQIAQIQYVVQREAGGVLTERLLKGLKSVSAIGITIVGFTVRVNILWLAGGNIYALSELGCCRLPHSTASLKEALKTARIFLGIKNLLKRSKDIVAALLGEAHMLRFENADEGRNTKSQSLIPDLTSPKKPKTRQRR